MVDVIHGMDVSVVQAKINWTAEKAAGRNFVICRCGVGNNGIDQNYTTNITGAKAAGFYIGAYHFIFPLPANPTQPLRDPVKQAQYHFNAAQGALPFCDLEWPVKTDWSKWSIQNANQIVDWTMTYLDAYEKLQLRPILYTYPDYMTQLGNPSAFANEKLWIASYQANSPAIPKPFTSYVMWQINGGGGKLSNGIAVDEDVVNDLAIWTPIVAASLPPALPPNSILTVPPVPTAVPVPPVIAQLPISPTASAKPNFIELVWHLITGLLNKLK